MVNVSRTKNHVKLFLEITDHQGIQKLYHAVPSRREQLPPGKSFGFLVWEHVQPGKKQKTYIVSLSREGEIGCTCPGMRGHGHCKHSKALRACGLLRQPVVIVAESAR